jgi:hypothetical protein
MLRRTTQLSEVDTDEAKAARRVSVRTVFIGASILLFLVSLTQNGYYRDGDRGDAWAPSFSLLLVGWLGVFAGIPAWLANPMLAVAWWLMGRRRSALVALG